MRRSFQSLACILLGLALSGCGSDTAVQGGGATETDNTIHLLATTTDGAPVAGARVQLVRTDTWLRDVEATGSPTIVDLTCDNQGRVRLDSLPTGEWSAQIEAQSMGAILPLTRDSATRTLVLRPLSKVTIRLRDLANAALMAVGTAWKSRLDSVGKSVLYLPPGNRAVVADLEEGIAAVAALSLASGKAIDTQLAMVPRRIQLDDFSTGDSRTTLSRYTGLGGWFVNLWGARAYSDQDSTGPSYKGKFSVRYTVSDSGNAVLSGIIFGDRNGFRSQDFSKLDSLCFDARGNGWVDLFFIEYAPDNSWRLSANSRLKDLDSTAWKHVCVVPDSLQDHWAEVKTRANTIAFLARRGNLLEIRNMVLWGVPLEDLAR